MSSYNGIYYERNNKWKPSLVPYSERIKNKHENTRADSTLKKYKFLEKQLNNELR